MEWGPVVVAGIYSIPVYVGLAYSMWRSRRNGTAIQEIHIMYNRRMDEMLALTKSAAHAAGVADEKAATAFAVATKVETLPDEFASMKPALATIAAASTALIAASVLIPKIAEKLEIPDVPPVDPLQTFPSTGDTAGATLR